MRVFPKARDRSRLVSQVATLFSGITSTSIELPNGTTIEIRKISWTSLTNLAGGSIQSFNGLPAAVIDAYNAMGASIEG